MAPSRSSSSLRTSTSKAQVTPKNLKEHIRPHTISRQPTQTSPELANTPGLRSAEAFIRPSPIATHGDVVQYGFDLSSATFSFSLIAPSATPEDAPTEMYLPDFHFPTDKITVQVSGGKWQIEVLDVDGQSMQLMKWWHGVGEQSMTVTGRIRKTGAMGNQHDGDAGYFDMVRRIASDCTVM